MPEKVMPGPVQDLSGIREAVCIHTRKIYDSCRDKDCIEDLRFYPHQSVSIKNTKKGIRSTRNMVSLLGRFIFIAQFSY